MPVVWIQSKKETGTEIKLNGNSGCILTLYEGHDGIFVRKSSGSPAYNSRLKRQCIKQRYFNFLNNKIRTPQIFCWGIINGLFYFDMEYVHGMTLAKKFGNMPADSINELISLFFDSYPSIQNAEYRFRHDSGKIFKQKLLQMRAAKITWCGSCSAKAFDMLAGFDFSHVPYGFSCGDLTLENILISSSNDIYIIDLLDSFYSSWMIDAAKLLQDLELKWSYRHSQIDLDLELRLETAKQSFIDYILRRRGANGLEQLITIYYILLMNVLRIAPYVNDRETEIFLQNMLEKVIAIIKNMEEKKK